MLVLRVIPISPLERRIQLSLYLKQLTEDRLVEDKSDNKDNGPQETEDEMNIPVFLKNEETMSSADLNWLEADTESWVTNNDSKKNNHKMTP